MVRVIVKIFLTGLTVLSSLVNTTTLNHKMKINVILFNILSKQKTININGNSETNKY